MSARLLAAAATMLAAVLTAASPAQAQCPGRDGTLPASGPSVTAVGAHPHVVYVDDRDAFDLDDDGDAGGIWIYLESNGRQGLQRGDRSKVWDAFERSGVPYPISIDPIHVPLPPNPVHPHGITLFPCGWQLCTAPPFPGGPLLSDLHDHCLQPDPDTLLL